MELAPRTSTGYAGPYWYRMSHSGLISSNCAAQFRYQQASLGTGTVQRHASFTLVRMRGLSTTGHFYGHSNAHKTLDVLSAGTRLCVWVFRGLFGRVLWMRLIFTSLFLLRLLLPLLAHAMPSCWLKFMTICWISAFLPTLPPQTFPSSCSTCALPISLFPFPTVTWHTRLPKHNEE